MKGNQKPRDEWTSTTGVILAVAGSAVGIANFLRFPGACAQYGGGAFMIAYFLSLLIVALPIAWAEWTMGRMGGQKGFSACPGILNSIRPHILSKACGVLGVLVPLVIYFYLSYIGAWCLGYAVNIGAGKLHFDSAEASQNFWLTFIGGFKNGSAVGFGMQQVGIYLMITVGLHFVLVYKGISRGIERFSKFAVPTLFILAIIILVRVLTLGTPNPEKPQNSISNGLGFMWNPTKVYLEQAPQLANEANTINEWERKAELLGKPALLEAKAKVAANPEEFRIAEVTLWKQLLRPKMWLTAASQIFFSLSVGLGLVITYASYMRKDDDVVLSSLSAISANEVCEVGLGGLISIPAAFAFLGAGALAGTTIFSLGFKAFPLVFSSMPGGNLFGAAFFFLLFLAASNGCISCLQPSIAFLEETIHLKRKQSVCVLSVVCALCCSFVIWFSKDAKALSTLDFWAGNFLVFVLATIMILFFGWILGPKHGFAETEKGASMRIPRIFYWIARYVCPLFLLSIFAGWVYFDVLGEGANGVDEHILELFGIDGHAVSSVAWACVGIIFVLYLTLFWISVRAKSYQLKNKE